MRRRNIDPAVAADLEAIDAALAGTRPDPELRLVADEVRAGTPAMTPAFAARLDAAVADGFPAAPAAAGSGGRRRPRLTPALGLAGAAAAAVVIGVSLQSSTNGIPREGSSSSASSSSTAADSAASAGKSAAAPAIVESSPTPSAATPAPSSANSTAGQDRATAVPPPGAGPRRIQRAADLTISTPIGKLQDTSDAVTAVSDRLGGYVQSSNVSANGDAGEATFDLRIPSSRLDDAMAALSRLGHVRARTQQTQDITASFSSALSRLQDARAERRALLRALATATTPGEVESLQARLRIARSQIIAAGGELAQVRRASNLARISVTVLGVAGETGATAGKGKPWTPGRALHDAVRVLSVAASVAIVTVAGAVPAALLGLMALLAFRAYRRRRRELALDLPTPAV
ncbi:MAG: hypothetical protein QOG68_235 [Solirubrobacteraceae bacterium]|nr:hypothetical protein [Solirubrobacteraceae bacterium]